MFSAAAGSFYPNRNRRLDRGSPPSRVKDVEECASGALGEGVAVLAAQSPAVVMILLPASPCSEGVNSSANSVWAEWVWNEEGERGRGNASHFTCGAHIEGCHTRAFPGIPARTP